MPSFELDLPQAECYTRENGDQLQQIVNELRDVEYVAFDTETTGLKIYKDVPLFISLAWERPHPGVLGTNEQRRVLIPTECLDVLDEAIDDPFKIWTMANAKFDMHMANNVGRVFRGDVYDVAVMHALLKEDAHDLKYMAKSELGWSWAGFVETFGKIPKATGPGPILLNCWNTNRQKLIEYACNDAYGTFHLLLKFMKELQLQYTNQFHYSTKTYDDGQPVPHTLWEYFFHVEAPFTKALWACEHNGIQVDLEYLASKEAEVQDGINRVSRKLNNLAGKIIRPSAAESVNWFLFEKHKIKPVKFTKGGKKGTRVPAIDENAINFYADNTENKEVIEFCETLLEFRDLTKTMSTYIKGLHKHVDSHGRVHTRFNQDIARTGRLSSADPNLQNVKSAAEDDYCIRQAFVAPPGEDLIVGDYEQLESRLLAAAACEPGMIRIFELNQDPHIGNAVNVFGTSLAEKYGRIFTYEEGVKAKKMEKALKEGSISPEEFTEEMEDLCRARSDAKTLGYGVTYGMKAKNLSRRMKCEVYEAQEKIDMYMETYPAVNKFLDECLSFTRATGYCFSYLGRRRFLPDIRSGNPMDRWSAERQCMNTVIQATAADAAKNAMILCHNAELDKKYGAKMLLQIHDELVFQCPKGTSKEAMEEIIRLMENPFTNPLSVQLKVSMGRGPSWNKAK